MATPLILGTPFIALLCPFQTIEEGIKTTKLGNTIFFHFLHPLVRREINQIQENPIIKTINLIQRKKAHINFLTKE